MLTGGSGAPCGYRHSKLVWKTQEGPSAGRVTWNAHRDILRCGKLQGYTTEAHKPLFHISSKPTNLYVSLFRSEKRKASSARTRQSAIIMEPCQKSRLSRDGRLSWTFLTCAKRARTSSMRESRYAPGATRGSVISRGRSRQRLSRQPSLQDRPAWARRPRQCRPPWSS